MHKQFRLCKRGIMKKDYRKQAKVLLLDIEVSPSLSWNYGQYQTNAIRVEKPPVLLSYAYKWLGDKGAPKCRTIVDTAPVRRDNHTMLVKELWQLLDEANIVVAHNLDRFDYKMCNTFFIRCGLTPPSFYQHYDTLKTARRYFKLDNNKLDYLGQLLCDEGKTDVKVGDLWYDILFANGKKLKTANKLLKEYNIQDVVLLEKIYDKLLPFADNHPNMALAAGIDFICPKCGHEAGFRVRAYRRTGVQINAIQYSCRHCGGCITRPLTKDEREELKENGRFKANFRNIS